MGTTEAIKIRCVVRYLNKSDKILAYRVVDIKNNFRTVSADDLRGKIKSGAWICDNLTLTSDNRLIISGKAAYIPKNETLTSVGEERLAKSLAKNKSNTTTKGIVVQPPAPKPVRQSGKGIITSTAKPKTAARQGSKVVSKPQANSILSEDMGLNDLSLNVDAQKPQPKRSNVADCNTFLGRYKLMRQECPFTFECDTRDDSVVLTHADDAEVIVIPSFVTSLCSSTFEDCTKLRTVKTEGTALTSIASAFSDCRVASLDLREMYVGNVFDMSYAFNGCSASEILVDTWDTSNVKDMQGMFGSCVELVSLNVSSFNTSKVKLFDSMFRSTLLRELDVSNFDFSSAENMSEMFADMNVCESIKMGTPNTGRVRFFRGMFTGCINLKELDMSILDTHSATDMSNMFMSCRRLEKLDLSNFDTRGVVDMSYMFSCCESLKSLSIAKFNTAKVKAMCGMFKDCWSLSSLDLRHFDTGSCTTMKYMFSGMKNLTQIDISSFNTEKVRSLEGMFSWCKALRQVNLKSLCTSNVITMANMFFGCSSLASLDLSGFDTSNVTSMSYMFAGCEQLITLDLHNFKTSNCSKMAEMFADCMRLRDLNISGFDLFGVTFATGMFRNCRSIKNPIVLDFGSEYITCTGIIKNTSDSIKMGKAFIKVDPDALTSVRLDISYHKEADIYKECDYNSFLEHCDQESYSFLKSEMAIAELMSD